MRRRLGPAGAVVAAVSSAFISTHISSRAAQREDAAVRLPAGSRVERRLLGEETHTYELRLHGGEYVGVAVAQLGVDVTVRTIAPDGTVLADFNDELTGRGEERAAIAAESDGTYSLIVKAAYPRVASGAYAIGIVEQREVRSDDRSIQDARTRRAEYDSMFEQYQFASAQPLVERALALSERARGPDDLEVARVASDLGRVYQRSRESAKALPLYERAAAIFETAFGAEHPLTAQVWDSLAATYERVGQRPKAEKLAQRALEISEKTVGPEHPLVAACLVTVANLRADGGDADDAEAMYLRALAIIEKVLGPDHPRSAVVLNNIGSLLLDSSKFAEAEPFLQRGLAIDEKTLGPDALSLAIELQNLGIVARQRNDLAKAEAYNLRALAIRQKTLGPEHSDIAATLNNLAIIYRSRGDVARSLATHFQALAIWEKNAGPYHGATVVSLGNIARTYAGTGDVANAIAFQRRVDAAIETQLALNLAIGSERQKLAFAVSLADRTERTISLDVATHFTEPDATALAAQVLLQRKGRVLDAMTDARAAVRERLDSADRELLDRLSATTTQLARLALGAPANGPNSPSGDRTAAIRKLEAQKEKLEAELSEHSAEFRVQSQPVTVEAVRRLLPAGAALIEFAVYRPFDPKVDRNNIAYGEPHYVAYVLRADVAPRGAALGPTRTIDAAVGALREALRDPDRGDVAALARSVDERVMRPVRALAGDARHLLISPDGALNLIPFEALRDEHDRYLIERYAFTYLGSGRDLLKMQIARTSSSGPVIVADPVFGERAATAPIGSGAPPPADVRPRSITTVDDLSSAYFAPLSGTALEAQRIKALFPDATVLTRERATKAALVQVQAPRMLHIATHGFFVEDAKRRIDNPLLRAGLALTGANRRAGADHARADGIITALEASNMNLWGTKLVTLSACDTGVGEVKNGEGVYGLRRAFFLAGAETLTMSLWAVSDYVTREVMTAYYGGLKRGLGRGEALRQAQLAMLARHGRQHPFFWAGFIQAGEWAPLDGRR